MLTKEEALEKLDNIQKHFSDVKDELTDLCNIIHDDTDTEGNRALGDHVDIVLSDIDDAIRDVEMFEEDNNTFRFLYNDMLDLFDVIENPEDWNEDDVDDEF